MLRRFLGCAGFFSDDSQQILAVIREEPDLTLNEFVSILRKRRVSASRSALSRFFGSPWHDAFLAYIEQRLAPTLKRGDIVVADDVSFHKVAGVEAAICALAQASDTWRSIPRTLTLPSWCSIP